MKPQREAILEELRLAQARLIQRLCASNETWNELQMLSDMCAEMLPVKRQLQAAARRYENTPILFCEKHLGFSWFEVPEQASTRQLRELIKIWTSIPVFPIALERHLGLDGKALMKQLQILAMRSPGRKPLGIYAKALTMRRTHPPTPMHRICLELNPAYSRMSPAQRRVERERMRSGITRLERKRTPNLKSPRNTRK